MAIIVPELTVQLASWDVPLGKHRGRQLVMPQTLMIKADKLDADSDNDDQNGGDREQLIEKICFGVRKCDGFWDSRYAPSQCPLSCGPPH